MPSGKINIAHRLLNSPVIYVVVVLLLSSCTATKFIPKDEILYTGAEIKIKPIGKIQAKKRVKELMDQNISPKPNTSIFGMRPGLWFYYKAGPLEKRKGLRAFIKNKLGQVPIYMSDVDPEKTRKLLKGHLINYGFFQTEVSQEKIIKGKTGKIKYTATVHRAYRLRNITYPKDSGLFHNIDSIKRNSFLKKGQRYHLERLQAEQERIEQELENYGYYFFDNKHLIFEADSTVGDKQVDLLLTLEKGVPEKAKRIYHLGDVTIYPDYTLSQDTLFRKTEAKTINGYRYIDRLNYYKPSIITQVINLKPGNIYRRVDREYTVSHLMSLGSFKFVDVQFHESPKDSSRLDASIYLTPYLEKSIRADLQATSKSNNFVGPGINIKFSNRNLFRGSERFDLTVTSGYEVQYSRKVNQPLNAFELGFESGISVPRFVTPFEIYYPTRKYLPTTDIKAGFRLQQRIGFFRLNSFNLAYGYTWRENTLKTHELYPIDINYMKLGHTSETFNDLIASNRFLARSLENQFIMGARYSYTLNTQVNKQRVQKFREQKFERSNFYFNGRIESAGNLVHLLRGGQFDNDLDNPEKKIFGSAYSQFLRAEADFRYYLSLSKTNTIANRIIVGTGYAFGNSVTMPYIRQFAAGGSNSVRAFPARSLGPGTYYVRSDPNNENKILFIDQRGDVKIEGSTEFRFNITKKLVKGAVFMDAGNIWLWRPNTALSGDSTNDQVPAANGKFPGAKFVNELAVGTGFGTRFDFNFFVLRLDLAFPVRKPWLPDGQRWVWNQIDLGSSQWRKENLILNIAIGYPF
jgi:outer membrane protein insertion porin family